MEYVRDTQHSWLCQLIQWYTPIVISCYHLSSHFFYLIYLIFLLHSIAPHHLFFLFICLLLLLLFHNFFLPSLSFPALYPIMSDTAAAISGGTRRRRLPNEAVVAADAPSPITPTAQLAELCTATNWNPTPAHVEELVRNGGDILSLPSPTAGEEKEEAIPIVFEFVARGNVECLRACLKAAPQETLRRLFFATTTTASKKLKATTRASQRDADEGVVLAGPWKRTLLHYVLDYVLDEGVTHEMLRVILDTVAADNSQTRTLNWEQQDAWGLDILNTAAYRSRVAVLWPLVRPLPYFQCLIQKRKEYLRSNPSCVRGGGTLCRRIHAKDGSEPLVPRFSLYTVDFNRMTTDEQQDWD
eukprot:gene6372-4597_t